MGLSFLKGLVAAVNPCAFVLLPTYLAYFLGSEAGRPGDQRSTVRRALLVSGSVSAGFLGVFVTIGLLSEYVTRWIEEQAKYFTLVVAVVFIVGGLLLLTGRKLPISTPRLQVDRRDRTVATMALYGVVYAITSISCTLPLFVTTMIGNGRRDGFGSGVAHVVAYGAGMALVVSALTVTLAVTNTGLLGLLRRGAPHVDRVAAVLVVLSGVYLLHYFWVVEVNEGSSPFTSGIQELQERIQLGLNDHWQLVAVVLTAIVAGAATFAFGRRRSAPERRPSRSAGDARIR
jgi:cytochrome c-type biogenesis protein